MKHRHAAAGEKNAKADGVSGQGCEEDVVTATEEEQNQIRTGSSRTDEDVVTSMCCSLSIYRRSEISSAKVGGGGTEPHKKSQLE